MRTLPAAAGISLHSGWAIVVSVATRGDGPVVIDRRRLDLTPPELPSQPYHHEALELDLAQGQALVLEVRQAVSERARTALQGLQNDVAASFDLVALALRVSRPLPATLAGVLASRARYIADSEIYRDAMHNAAIALGLRVFEHPKAEEFEFGAQALNTDPADLAERVRNWRKVLGPPWQQDHHAAAAAAIGALARASQP
jgi:hypothetical protein